MVDSLVLHRWRGPYVVDAPGTVSNVSDDSAARVSLPALLAVVGLAVAVAGGSLALAAWALLDGSAPDAASPSTPAQAPVGAAADVDQDGWAPWAVNDDGSPVRWDPCRPIELVVNPEGTYPGFSEDLADAVQEIAAATDLQLTIGPEVEEAPAADRELHQVARYGDRWAPVLVAAAAPGERGLPLRDTDRAIAAPVAVGPPGSQVFVSGQIVLNRDRDDLAAGTGDRADAWGAILRHELGHLLGLDHVDDPDQLMHGHPVPGEVRLGDGDRRGLQALGAGECLDVPPAGPVDVDVSR
jgi:hypothetical protein